MASNTMGNYILAREKFYRASKYPQESVQEWLQRIHGLADNCGFRECRTELLQDLFVIGIGPGYIQDKLLQRINEQPGVQLPTLFKLAIAAETRFKIGGTSYTSDIIVNEDLNDLLKNLDLNESKLYTCAEDEKDKEKQEAVEDPDKQKLEGDKINVPDKESN